MKKQRTVAIVVLVTVAVFASAAYLYTRDEAKNQAAQPGPGNIVLAPADAPVIGPANAPVTIVEFFDPSCEACRAAYPFVKDLLRSYPNDVRLVIRYAPFHQGSDEAVRILEAARKQGKYEPVLEAILTYQPEWAGHGAPDLNRAWEVAGTAGLDLDRARSDAASPDITRLLDRDVADLKAANIQQTPTFFVNGKPLPSLTAQDFSNLVQTEVQAAK